MCAQRSWNYLHFGAKESLPPTMTVSGKRSDGLFVKVEIKLADGELLDKLKLFESFRSCQCTNKLKCERHKEQQ